MTNIFNIVTTEPKYVRLISQFLKLTSKFEIHFEVPTTDFEVLKIDHKFPHKLADEKY